MGGLYQLLPSERTPSKFSKLPIHLNGHNFSSGDPISMILWFLKLNLSVGMSNQISFLTNYHGPMIICRKWEIWSCCKLEN